MSFRLVSRAFTALVRAVDHPQQQEESEPDQNEDRQQNHLNRHENLPELRQRSNTEPSSPIAIRARALTMNPDRPLNHNRDTVTN